MNYQQQLAVVQGLSVQADTQIRMDCPFCNGRNTFSVDTTEGSLNLKYNKRFLKKIINGLKNNGSRISLFIEPNIKDIKLAKYYYNVDCIEIHTGKFCNLVNLNKNYKKELLNLKRCSKYASNIGLEVHAGHGLTFKSAKILSSIKTISEFNIGHFLVGESIFIGLKKTIKTFKKILKK